jgi:serine/threonine-protein kinase RsbW
MASSDHPDLELDVENLIVRLELTIPGKVQEIPAIVKKIMAQLRQMKCAEGEEHHIELVLNEALANAVVHGCQEDPSHTVQIAVGCDEDRGVVIVVRDPGEGFDPKEVPSPVIGEQLFASHGRGIYLINQLMDHVRYRRGGTELWMRKK